MAKKKIEPNARFLSNKEIKALNRALKNASMTKAGRKKIREIK